MTMWFDLRREDLGFIDRAPRVHVVEASVAAPRAAVFAALAEPRSWPQWFPNVRAACYTTPPPYGVGTIRQATVGGTMWVEEMIAWEAETRWAWTVIRASLPFARAQVESFELTPAASGTRVRWTVALEPRLLARLGMPLMGRIMQDLFRRAMENLGVYLRAPAIVAASER
jgi:carbon monoxide dehydrogenase subunit G